MTILKAYSRHPHEHLKEQEGTLREVIVVVSLMMVPFIVVPNVLVLCIVAVFRRLKTAQNMLLASLAFNDFLAGLVHCTCPTVVFILVATGT